MTKYIAPTYEQAKLYLRENNIQGSRHSDLVSCDRNTLRGYDRTTKFVVVNYGRMSKKQAAAIHELQMHGYNIKYGSV